ncbi:MAG: outer membrane beta-barrel protein [bacterium]
MKSKNIGTLWLTLSLGLFAVSTGLAQTEKPASRFSPKGIKVAVGAGSLQPNSDQALNEGDAGFLSLGYGFTDHISLWLAVVGADHTLKNAATGQQDKASDESTSSFAGIELNLQHKFATRSRFQPYGKIGVGFYGLEDKLSDETLLGAGLNLGLGLDFFFAKHFGVGAEFTFKKLNYSHKSMKVAGGDLVSELDRKLDGDTSGFMITLTIQ